MSDRLNPKFRGPTLYVPVLASLAVFPLISQGNIFAQFVMILLFLYITLSVSWNLVGGYAGQISLGHGAFFGLGAYTTAMLWLRGVPPYLGMLASGVTALSLALLMTPVFRLRGDYFAIGTLGLNETIKEVFLNWEAAGAASGLHLPLSGTVSVAPNYYASFILAVVTVLVTKKLVDSRFGYALVGIRENESAAMAVGVWPLKYKLLALCVGGLFAGIAGGTYTFYFLFIQPYSTFGIDWSVYPIFMTIIGGRGTTSGPILGAILFVAMFYSLNWLISEVSLLLFGALLVVVITFIPDGVVPTLRKLLKSKVL